MDTFQLTDYSQSEQTDKDTIAINSEDDLRLALETFGLREPGFLDLVSPEGDVMSLGIGGPLACVMFMDASGDPPYLWALGAFLNSKDDVEFERGGTPTPVSLSRCLPFEEVVKIATFYFLHRQLPSNVKWDED